MSNKYKSITDKTHEKAADTGTAKVVPGSVRQHLSGKDSKDFLTKVRSLKLGEALSLPSPLPGLCGNRVVGLFVDAPDAKTFGFDLMWFDTFVGKAWAQEMEDGRVELYVDE